MKQNFETIPPAADFTAWIIGCYNYKDSEKVSPYGGRPVRVSLWELQNEMVNKTCAVQVRDKTGRGLFTGRPAAALDFLKGVTK